MLFLIIFSLFRGRQTSFLTIFKSNFVIPCAIFFLENLLTDTKVMFKNRFVIGNFAYGKIARKGSNYLPGKSKKN